MHHPTENLLTDKELKEAETSLEAVRQFIGSCQNTKLCCVTTGGTAVDLEKNTVRTLENFSTGMRGSLLAEHFLESGWDVIYLYRDRSIMPFSRGVTVNQIILSSEPEKHFQTLKKCLEKQKQYSKNILYVPFRTIYLYLHLSLAIKNLLPSHSIYILCAAVSDFVPEILPEHKIHTAQTLTVNFKSSPKILGQLVRDDVLTVSFKLETEENKLIQRMQKAIDKYRVHLVVGNLLNRKTWAIAMKNDKSKDEITEPVELNLTKYLIELRDKKFKT